MNKISVLVKPASSACNLRCKYCFYTNVATSREVATHGVLAAETAALLAQRIAEAVGFSGLANISFQGGEPLLAGLDWFKSFAAEMDRYPGVRPNWILQTNGTLLNEEWCAFLAKREFLVGISVDGTRANTNRYRVDASGEGVYDRAIHAIDLLEAADVEYNILTVVTRQLAQKPKQLMQFYLNHDYVHVQLIPCLPPLDGTDDGVSLRPQDFRSFYLGFFRAWKKVFESERLIHINLFEDLADMLEGYNPVQCGMTGRCTVQYVVEANGDVYPCDFYCLDEYKMGNIADAPLRDLSVSSAVSAFLDDEDCRREPCTGCPYSRFCNGGCRRQNVCYLTDRGCAYRDVLSEVLPELILLYDLY